MFLATRGLGGSASSLLTKGYGFIARVVRHGRRAVQEIAGVVTEKTKEYYVTAILMTINSEDINDPPIGHTQGKVSNKNINTSAILIKINHMKLFLERIFISAGNIIGVRKHKKNLKDYRRKL
tara:strand:- start:10168 stop:10536 length:369 start_codon:yes stop_codon:yes gene_type:complete